MTNKKNWLGILAAALVFGMAAAGCTTVETAPQFYTNNPNYEFIILGEVVYETENDGTARAGFRDLLAAARQRYPNADYVIDIMIDTRVTTTKFFSSRSTRNYYTMRGTAIQYVRNAE